MSKAKSSAKKTAKQLPLKKEEQAAAVTQPDSPYRLVSIANIHADPAFNCRSGNWLQDEEFQLLVSSIRETGLRVALEVRPTTLKEQRATKCDWYLVAGFRRHAALQSLGATEVPITISKYDESQARLRNIQENVNRQGLSPADAVAGIKGYMSTLTNPLAVSNADLAEQIGISASYMGQLVKLLRLTEKVLTAWRAAQTVITVQTMIAVSELEPDEQWEAFVAATSPVPGGSAAKKIKARAKKASFLGAQLRKLIQAGFLAVTGKDDPDALAKLLGAPKTATPKDKQAITQAFVASLRDS